jgi:hypothetical protein
MACVVLAEAKSYVHASIGNCANAKRRICSY